MPTKKYANILAEADAAYAAAQADAHESVRAHTSRLRDAEAALANAQALVDAADDQFAAGDTSGLADYPLDLASTHAAGVRRDALTTGLEQATRALRGRHTDSHLAHSVAPFIAARFSGVEVHVSIDPNPPAPAEAPAIVLVQHTPTAIARTGQSVAEVTMHLWRPDWQSEPLNRGSLADLLGRGDDEVRLEVQRAVSRDSGHDTATLRVHAAPDGLAPLESVDQRHYSELALWIGDSLTRRYHTLLDQLSPGGLRENSQVRFSATSSIGHETIEGDTRLTEVTCRLFLHVLHGGAGATHAELERLTASLGGAFVPHLGHVQRVELEPEDDPSKIHTFRITATMASAIVDGYAEVDEAEDVAA